MICAYSWRKPVPTFAECLECALTLEEPVLRPGQAEIFAERLAFILPPENPALLEFRDHPIDEVVQTFWQIGKHDVEAVAAAAHQPFLHLVGYQLRRADKGEARERADALGKLAHRELVAGGDIDK